MSTTRANTKNLSTKKRPAYGPARAVVDHVEMISPSFVRITFSGEDMVGVGSHEPVYDQRIKLIFPTPGHPLPDMSDGKDWYRAWLELPENTRGSMRTYSIRELSSTEHSTRLTVDFVLHMEPGLTGPAATWASLATPGDEILIIAPRLDAESMGGIEFNHGTADTVVLVGDETATPAIARILEDLSHSQPDIQGVAFIEVPTLDDILPIAAPRSLNVRWLARNGTPHGELLTPAVLTHLGLTLIDATPAPTSPTDELLWETPAFSASGETIENRRAFAGAYYWIAGESGVVTRLRRALVKDHGLDRSQVAFMGYWKHGVAMRG